MSDDLVTFLRARLDEDERVALAVEDNSAPWSGQWESRGPDVLRTRNGHVLAMSTVTDDGRALPIPLKPGTAEHWARHDPARVLAEVAGKRQIVAASNVACPQACHTEHSFSGSCSLRWMGPLHEDATGRWLQDDTGARFTPPPVTTDWTLRLLALPYADHPDYRPEWAPSA